MSNFIDLKPALDFLDDLSRHNERTWFNEHKPVYENARGKFEQFIDGIIDELRVSDNLGGLRAKDCIARIYRDVRFSKDKSPYKINFGAMLTPGGWGSSWLGYYISLEPGGKSMVAGGIYNPTPEQINRFRQVIDQDASEFKQVTGAKDFVNHFGEVEGDRLKTAPRGYDKAHPEVKLLQLKQVFAMHRYPDQEVLADGFMDNVTDHCRLLKPFLDYLAVILN